MTVSVKKKSASFRTTSLAILAMEKVGLWQKHKRGMKSEFQIKKVIFENRREFDIKCKN
jgi:hypothetical protein